MVPSAAPGSFDEVRFLAASRASSHICSAAFHKNGEENGERRCSLYGRKQRASTMDLESIMGMRNAAAMAGIRTVDLRCWFELNKGF